MPCDFDRIDALLGGSLEESERQSVLNHIEKCSACRAYFDAMQMLEGDAQPPADRRVKSGKYKDWRKKGAQEPEE